MHKFCIHAEKMKQKKSLILIILVLTVLCVGLTACNKNGDDLSGVKVTFVLEGGMYKQSTNPINHYYKFAAGTENLIVDPSVVGRRADEGTDPITKAGYVLDGWYRTKTETESGVEYGDKWNFATDKVTSDGVTLYAKWRKAVEYTYNVCYIDDNGEKKVLGSYLVSAGDTFGDLMDYAKNRTGYTWVSMTDKDGNPWDETFTHPGGDESLAIDVYFVYIKGIYTKVATAEELADALGSNKNVMLTADIDMGGETLELKGKNVKSFVKKIYGGGHTISNFKAKAYVGKNDLFDIDGESGYSFNGIFGSLDGATVTDVNFKDVTLEIDAMASFINHVYIAPVAGRVKNSVLKNVTVDGMKITLARLPEGFSPDNLVVNVTDAAAFKDESSEIVGCTVKNVTFKNGTETK